MPRCHGVFKTLASSKQKYCSRLCAEFNGEHSHKGLRRTKRKADEDAQRENRENDIFDDHIDHDDGIDLAKLVQIEV